MQEEKKVNRDEAREEPVVEEVKPQKRKRSKKFLLLYVAAFAFLVYASFTIIKQGTEIAETREKKAKIEQQIELYDIKIEEQEQTKKLKGEDLSKYIEKIAREDLDYVKDGERVFMTIAG